MVLLVFGAFLHPRAGVGVHLLLLCEFLVAVDSPVDDALVEAVVVDLDEVSVFLHQLVQLCVASGGDVLNWEVVFAASFCFPALGAFAFSVPVVGSVVFVRLCVDDEPVAGACALGGDWFGVFEGLVDEVFGGCSEGFA